MQEKDFLQGYEIRNWDFTPRIYKILSTAVLINIISVFVVGQTNMLARSACESPFVNRICQVLDTVYVSTKILTTDAGYVVKEYQQDRIKDSDVVWIDQTNVEPGLQYPGGYFQIANRDELASLQADVLQGFPPSPIAPNPFPAPPILPPITPRRGRGSLSGKPILPKKLESVIDGDIPDDPLGGGNTNKKPEKDTVANGNVVKDDKNPIEKDTVRNSDPLSGVEINKKPLYDFVDGVVEKVNARKVDLNRQFRVAMNAFITEEGLLDSEKSVWIVDRDEGDPAMILVAKDAIEKVGISGWLVYLSDQGIMNVRIEFFQDDEQLGVNITSVMANENAANSKATSLRVLVQSALFAHNNGLKKFKEDELTLLKSANVVSEKNIIKMNFNLKKAEAQQIIDTRLKEYQADKAKREKETPTPKQPNGMIEKSNTRDRSGT